MADGERDYLRPDAGAVDADRRHGVGKRFVCLDDLHDGARCWNTERKRDIHAHRHHRLQHCDRLSERIGEPRDTYGDGVADGERNYLRPNAGVFNTERWHGISGRFIRLGNIHDSACHRDDQRERDL